jgi:hypothetical protein
MIRHGHVRGVNAHEPSLKLIKKIRDIGFDWVRVDVDYNRAEKNLCKMLDNLLDSGLHIYANPVASGFRWPPRDYLTWLRTIVARYPEIEAWGLWNEPDNDRFFSGNLRDFIAFFLPVADYIKSQGSAVAAPNCMDRNFRKWLPPVLNMFGDRIDIVAQHFYPSNGNFFEFRRFVNGSSVAPCIWPGLKKVVRDHSDADIWIAETGCTVTEVGPTKQASYLKFMLTEARDYVDGVFWYHIQDDQRYPERDFGLIDKEGNYKSSAIRAWEVLNESA